MRYQCASCGKYFNPEKDEICPKCGAAAAPSVMTRIERRRTAERLRAEGKFDYDDHCHEDDSWAGSYGASAHRAAVRSHEAQLRADYSAHRPADNPTRLSNANAAGRPAATPAARPAANAAPRPAARQRSSRTQNKPKPVSWVFLAWMLYVLFRVLAAVFD